MILRLRLADRRTLFGVYELLHFGSFLFYLGEVFGAELLVDRKFLLRVFLLADVHVVSSQAVMRIGQVRIKRQGPHVLGNRLLVLVLVRIKIAQLHMGFGQRVIQGDRLLQQGFHRAKVGARIPDALALPQTHSVIVLRKSISRLHLRVAAKSLDNVVGLQGRAVVGLGQENIAAGIVRVQVRGSDEGLDGLIVLAARVVG